MTVQWLILLGVLIDRKMIPVDIFGPDNAIVGGQKVIAHLRQQNLKNVTGVIVDISALSAGTSFPIIGYFVECIDRERKATNLRLFVIQDPRPDTEIGSIASDAPGYVHGFRGRSTLSSAADVARLWLPLLATGRRAVLERLHGFIEPHDTCPVLPFPATDPRIGDALAEEYLMNELETPWSVDVRNIVYTHEGEIR